MSAVPCWATIEFGRRPGDAGTPLCADEVLAIVSELADIGVAHLCLALLSWPGATDSLLRSATYARQRALSVTVALPATRVGDVLGELAGCLPAAFAIPLWDAGGEQVDAAAAIRAAQLPLVVRSAPRPDVAAAEIRLSAARAEALGASRWEVALGGGHEMAHCLATFVGVAARGRLHVRLEGAPFGWSEIVARVATVPAVAERLSFLGDEEGVVISWLGEVLTGSGAGTVAGSVRRQTVAAIFERSRAFAALRERPAPPPRPRRSPASPSFRGPGGRQSRVTAARR